MTAREMESERERERERERRGSTRDVPSCHHAQRHVTTRNVESTLQVLTPWYHAQRHVTTHAGAVEEAAGGTHVQDGQAAGGNPLSSERRQCGQSCCPCCLMREEGEEAGGEREEGGRQRERGKREREGGGERQREMGGAKLTHAPHAENSLR
jgi:hypothetical protein